MQEIDEKLEAAYEKMERQEERIISKIDKSETRSKEGTNEKLKALKELIDASNTARSESINSELARMQKCSEECQKNCVVNRGAFAERLKVLENWKAMNWQRTIIYAGTAIVASFQVFGWLKEFVK